MGQKPADIRRVLAVPEGVRAVLLRAVEHGLTRVEAAKLVAMLDLDAQEAFWRREERPAERRDRGNAEALRMVLEAEAEGLGCHAIKRVALQLVADRRDPAEVAAMIKHLDRLRRNHRRRNVPHCGNSFALTE